MKPSNRSIIVLAMVFVVTGSGVLASQKIYKYRCPTCGRVEETTQGGQTLYCEGVEGHRHSKTTMQRIDEDAGTRVYKYECPVCHRIEESTQGGQTKYCDGTEGHRHSKTTMREIE